MLSLQESKGYDFESETDTETIAKLVKYMYDNRDSDDISFTTLVERVIQQLVMLGAGTRGPTHTHTDRHTQAQKPPVLQYSPGSPGWCSTDCAAGRSAAHAGSGFVFPTSDGSPQTFTFIFNISHVKSV